MSKERQVGSELRAALKARGCVLGADEARALAVLLIGLICDGLVVVETPARLPRTCNTGQSSYKEGGDSE